MNGIVGQWICLMSQLGDMELALLSFAKNKTHLSCDIGTQECLLGKG